MILAEIEKKGRKKKTHFKVAKSVLSGACRTHFKKFWSPKFITDVDQRSHNLCHLYPNNGLQDQK